MDEPKRTAIKLLTGHDGPCEWRALLEANLSEYCQRWGYALATKFEGWEASDLIKWWRKIELIRQELTECEWLVWLDSDCFVLNMTIPLERYTKGTFDLGVTGPFANTCPDKECRYWTNDCWSAGLMFLRNVSWTRILVEEWWKARTEKWRPGNCHEWMGDSAFLSCLKMHDPSFRSHVRVFPLDEIGWATLSGKPVQFLMHCYGTPGPWRRDTFERWAKEVRR